jgi:hypothetical protein
VLEVVADDANADRLPRNLSLAPPEDTPVTQLDLEPRVLFAAPTGPVR